MSASETEYLARFYCSFGCRSLTVAGAVPEKSYTYPLALLSSFPKLPADERLAELIPNLFQGLFGPRLFFEHLPPSALNRESFVPPLRFGVACLGSVCSLGNIEEAQTLFTAGISLWPVMVEVDNALARSVEMLLAV